MNFHLVFGRKIFAAMVAFGLVLAACNDPGSVDVDDTTTFTVTFNLNGGTFPEPIDLTITGLNHGAAIANPGTPVKEPQGAYYFAGWYSDAEFTIPWCFDSNRVYSDMTLFARWGNYLFTVTFNLNGGTLPETVDLTITGLNHGAAITDPGRPVRAPLGWFEFTGWYSDIDLTYQWDFSTSTVTADTTLFARWELTADAGNIGDPGPAADPTGYGLIFYRRDTGFVMADTNERAFFLVVSPSNDPIGLSFANPMPYSLIPGLSQDRYDETDRAIGRGRLNTSLIMEYAELRSLNMYVAADAYNYTGGGHTDWFLPSKDELERLRLVRDTPTALDNDPNIPLGPVFAYLRSSSQHRENHMWAYLFHRAAPTSGPSPHWIGSVMTFGPQSSSRPVRAF